MKTILIAAIAITFTFKGYAQTTDTIKISDNIILQGTSKPGGNDPLIIIDGSKQLIRGTNALKEVDPNTIESINIYKDESAIALYGAEGSNGVIEIKTKNSKSSIKGKLFLKSDSTLNGKVSGLSVRPQSIYLKGKNSNNFSWKRSNLKIEGKEPLYIVDGKEIFDIKSLNPENIESVTVLKEAGTSALYGEKAKDGVVIITTKATKKDSPKKN
ncbi:hypothetical protein DU508_08295 [Pedobacter chinensis]|uniref:TonB-dependent receptor plug domain-containing protein n=1 Tax=Pedobacter chinensis TaxID=2282421 RepID=A0A369Q4D0_9SPHI|nr:TonB-dependent receptor plug domain-containing protein [Pedobacter chinensis]RDC57178.1 hypothetical protein DU508_08295 [Pedobacter chinensis]